MEGGVSVFAVVIEQLEEYGGVGRSIIRRGILR